MAERYRSLTPPCVLILAFSSLGYAQGPQKPDAKATDAEAVERKKAEVEKPAPWVMSQIQAAVEAFLKEHHPTLEIEGCTLTPMTPNLYLVGVPVKDRQKGNRYVAQLTAERLRDVVEDEAGQEQANGELLWIIDYLTQEKMRVLARRHGFQQEVDRIESVHHRHSWGTHTWLDSYLLWHVLFRRPLAHGFMPGRGFSPLAPGYRFYDPNRPIKPRDQVPYRGVPAPTGGRSAVFLSGAAWRPPMVSQIGHLPGQAFQARGTGIGSKAPMGSVSRGGFGAAGRASGGAGA